MGPPLRHTTGPQLPELARKYGPLVLALRGLILRPDTPLEDDVKGTIAAQLDAARARLAAIRHDHYGGVPLLPGPAPARNSGLIGGKRPDGLHDFALGSCGHTHQFAAARRQRP